MFPWDPPTAPPPPRRPGNPYSQQGTDHRVKLDRYEEQVQKALSSFAIADINSSTAHKGEAIAQARRLGGRRAQMAKEEQLDKQLQLQQERVDAEEKRKKQAALAGQIASYETEQQRREREVQAICAQDPELRSLQAKIQVGAHVGAGVVRRVGGCLARPSTDCGCASIVAAFTKRD
jgi:hypothetical protein